MRNTFRRIVRRTIHRFAPPEMVAALQYRQTVLTKQHSGFPPKNIVVTPKAPAGSVLILAPHPDDEIIGPGGALQMHLKNQDPVTVLYLTDGRGGVLSDITLVPIRRREAEAIATAYPFKQIFWDIPDSRLTNDPATVQALSKILAQTRPDFIYLPSFFDRQHDHFAANKLLVKTLQQMDATTPTILGYEIWDNISYPNYILNISTVFEKKAAMMRMYETPMAAADFVALCRHRNALHYSLFIDSRHRDPEGYAEAFSRLEARQYVTLFNTYTETLQAYNSPLLKTL